MSTPRSEPQRCGDPATDYANPRPTSLRARLLRRLVPLLVKPILCDPMSAQTRRRRLARLTALSKLPLPAGIRLEQRPLAGLPAQWLSARAAASATHLLYFHGGAYAIGEPATYRDMNARLARLAGATVVAIDYRLAPEHPHPAAVEDVLAAYRALLAQGVPATKIVLAGDSAGGGLVMACALAAKQAGVPMPAALVCFSPWVDLTMAGASARTYADRDAILALPALGEFARSYAGALDLKTPLISPLYGELAGLPPLLIQVSDTEILYDDALRLATAARQAGVDVQLQVWRGVWHVWQLFAGKLPEADDALAEVGRFVRQRTDPS